VGGRRRRNDLSIASPLFCCAASRILVSFSNVSGAKVTSCGTGGFFGVVGAQAVCDLVGRAATTGIGMHGVEDGDDFGFEPAVGDGTLVSAAQKKKTIVQISGPSATESFSPVSEHVS